MLGFHFFTYVSREHKSAYVYCIRILYICRIRGVSIILSNTCISSIHLWTTLNSATCNWCTLEHDCPKTISFDYLFLNFCPTWSTYFKHDEIFSYLRGMKNIDIEIIIEFSITLLAKQVKKINLWRKSNCVKSGSIWE